LRAKNSGGRPATEASVHLFGRTGLIFLLAVLAGAAWLGQTLVVILIGLMLATAAVSRGWSRLSLNRVGFQRRLEEDRAFPGEEVGLTVRLENRKPLPLIWVEAADEMPQGLAPEGLELSPGERSGRGRLVVCAPLFWYQRATWRYRLKCRRRGYYAIGPARLTSGDVFGLFPRRLTSPQVDHLVVYPRLYDLADLGLPSRYPLGEARAASRLFQDPTRTIGLRQYTPEAPFKYIHWKASARHQSLQVKVFEPTTTLRVALFLDADGFAGLAAPSGEVHFELAVSLIASLADHLIGQRHPVGLFTNAASADRPGSLSLRPGSGPEQLMLILEALAKLGPSASQPFVDFLDINRADLPWGATLGLVSAGLSEALLGRLEGLERAGFRVVAYQVGTGPLPPGPIRCQRVLKPADLDLGN